MDKPISIHDVNGNVTVTVVEGNNNKTELSIGSFIEKTTKDCGLQLIYEDTFKKDNNTSTNFRDWLDGFSFNIKSVYHEREFRRNDILDNIKQQLESKGRLLILGESGTSKSIILMEILCDYLQKAYKIFHNLDLGSTADIKNLEYIENTIVELVDNGNNVMVVVDNIHNKTIANIFTLIKKIRDDHEDKLDKIKFLLAARQPEFGWAMDRGIFDSETIEKIDMLFDNDKKYNLAYFSQEEVKGFLDKYKEYNTQLRNISIEEHARKIFKDTEGHPIMVRFSVLQNGLENHVKKMYTDYLIENKSPNIERIKSVIACSLYDISSVPLTDAKLSEKLALKIPSLEIVNTMTKKNGNIWTTIHPRWDLQLFKYMFLLNEADVEIIKEAFGQVFINILNIESGSINQLTFLSTLYNTIAAKKFIDINLVQEIITLDIIKTKLDQEYKTMLYANILGVAFDELKDHHEAIKCYDEAIRINPDYADAHYNKGLSLSALGQEEEAIKCYDEAIRINPDHANALNDKGLALINLGKYQEAIEYFDKALKINPDYTSALNNKGLAFNSLGKYEEAIEWYDKALKINPKDGLFWDNKGYALSKSNRLEEAVECSDKAIDLDPSNANAWCNKSIYMIKKGNIDEAIHYLKKAIELDGSYIKVAKTDKDFDNIRNDDRFRGVVGY